MARPKPIQDAVKAEVDTALRGVRKETRRHATAIQMLTNQTESLKTDMSALRAETTAQSSKLDVLVEASHSAKILADARDQADAKRWKTIQRWSIILGLVITCATILGACGTATTWFITHYKPSPTGVN